MEKLIVGEVRMVLWKLEWSRAFRETPHKVESRKSPGRVGPLQTLTGGILYPTPVPLLSNSDFERKKYREILTAEVVPLDFHPRWLPDILAFGAWVPESFQIKAI